MENKYNMGEEDILFCKEMAMFVKMNGKRKFDEFRDKLWELAKKYHLNPSEAFIIYMDNYTKFNS